MDVCALIRHFIRKMTNRFFIIIIIIFTFFFILCVFSRLWEVLMYTYSGTTLV